MEQILIEFHTMEQKYLENIKETLNFIKRFKKLCNHGQPVAQIPCELSGNYKLLEQTFKDYQDIHEFNRKLSEIMGKKSQIDVSSLAVFFQQNSFEFKTKYSIYCYFYQKHTASIINNNTVYFNNLSHQFGTIFNLGQQLQRPQTMILMYLKVFSDLSNIAKENEDEELAMVLNDSRDIISSIDIIIDDLSKADSIQGYNGWLRKEGVLLKSGPVKFILCSKSNQRKGSFSAFEASSVHGDIGVGTQEDSEEGYMFLFEGSLILSRKKKNVYESVKFFSNFSLAVRILRDAKFELENVETNEKIWIFLEDNQDMLSWVQKVSKFLQKYNIFLKTFSSDHLTVHTTLDD